MNERDWDKSKMLYLDPNHEGSMIEDMARGMSQTEVAEFFGTNMEELNKSQEDQDFFRYHFRMGRAAGNRQAVGALFDQMKQRGGGQVALSYLGRFAEDWVKEIEADGETKGKKSFRVILDD